MSNLALRSVRDTQKCVSEPVRLLSHTSDGRLEHYLTKCTTWPPYYYYHYTYYYYYYYVICLLEK